MDFALIGPAIVLGLGCIGSAIGCGIAGMATHGVMSRVDEGHGKFIGISAMPSSQSIYAIVLTILMKGRIAEQTLQAWDGIGIGLFAGLAFAVSSLYQAKCIATGFQASAKQPNLFVKTLFSLGIVESFALFAFIFSLIIM